MWATPFATEDERAGGRAARRRRSARVARTFGQAMLDRPQHPGRHRHEPRSGDELDRPGRRRLPGRRTTTAGSSTIPLLRPGDVDRAGARRPLRRPALVAARCDQPRSRGLDAPADRSQRAEDRDRPDRQRRGRLAGARNRTASRASGRGACSASTLDYVMPVSADKLQRRADRAGRRRAERRGLAAGAGRGRLPAERRSRLAAARAAHLPEHPARRRIARAARSSRARASPTTRWRAGRRPRSGRPSIDIDEKRRPAAALRRQRHAARGRGQRQRADRRALSLGPPFAGAEHSAASVMNPARGRRLGVAERRRRRAARRWRCARTSPTAPCRRRSSAAAPGAKSANWRSGAPGSATGSSPSARGRSATRRSSPRRRPRRRRELVISAPERLDQALRRRWSPGNRRVSADGPLRYHVVLDGRELATPAGALQLRLDPRGLGSGRHQRADAGDRHRRPVDALGSRPRCWSTAYRRRSRSRVRRAVMRSACGSATPTRASTSTAVSVSFGDGHTPRPCPCQPPLRARRDLQVVVQVRDKLGNAGVVRQLVSVR